MDARELAERPLRPAVADQAARRVQDVGPAPQGREPEQELVLGAAQRRPVEQRLQRHEVAPGEGLPHARLQVGGQVEAVEQAQEELGVADVDLVAPQAGRVEAADGHRDHLGVRDRAGRAHELGADLVRLPAPGEAPGVVRQDRPRVAEPQRERRRAQGAGDQPGDGHGALPHHGQDRAVGVGQLEQPAPVVGVQAEGERLQPLERRGDDVPIAPAAHLGEDRFLGVPHGLRLLRQEVAEAGDVAKHLAVRPGEATSRPGPRRARRYSSSSSSISIATSSPKSMSPSSSSMSRLLLREDGSSSMSSSLENRSTSCWTRRSRVYGRNSTSRRRTIGKLGFPANLASWYTSRTITLTVLPSHDVMPAWYRLPPWMNLISRRASFGSRLPTRTPRAVSTSIPSPSTRNSATSPAATREHTSSAAARRVVVVVLPISSTKRFRSTLIGPPLRMSLAFMRLSSLVAFLRATGFIGLMARAASYAAFASSSRPSSVRALPSRFWEPSSAPKLWMMNSLSSTASSQRASTASRTASST